MPPLEPLPSEQALFSKHLFLQGYPLWNPDPVLLPQGLQGVGLKIGDVGTVDERGRFDTFFNILDPPPGSADSTPPIFPPIEENDMRCSSEDISPREVVSSPETSWDVDQVDVETTTGVNYKTTQYGATLSNDGAHIILPQGAQFSELGLQQRRLFENHARKHGSDWLERFRDRLGWPRSNSLYLLTGFYKTCSWAIASFGMQTAANTDPVHVHCILKEVDELVIRDNSAWQPSGRFKRKIGPAPDRQGKNNQTVFIQGITITPNLSEAGQSESQAGLHRILSAPSRLLSTLVGSASSSTTATATETPKSNVTIQHLPQVSQASHPSEIINLYLLAKEPSARIAVTHDSQWIAMLKTLKEGQPWTLEDLENHLEVIRERYDIAKDDDTVYLRDKEHGSLTGSGVDQSHSPGDLASSITPDRKPSAHGSFASGRRIVYPQILDPLRVDEGSLPHTTDLPSTSTSNYDLKFPSLPDQAIHVEEQMLIGPRPPRSFRSSINDVSEAIEPTSLPKPSIPDRPDDFLFPGLLSFIDTQVSASFGSRIASEEYTNAFPDFQSPWSSELDMIPQYALGHSVGRATPSSPSMSATPTHSSSSNNPDVPICQWVDDGRTCGALLARSYVGIHLKNVHGVRDGSQRQVSCLWLGCNSKMKKKSLVRHVRERHLGMSRQVARDA